MLTKPPKKEKVAKEKKGDKREKKDGAKVKDIYHVLEVIPLVDVTQTSLANASTYAPLCHVVNSRLISMCIKCGLPPFLLGTDDKACQSIKFSTAHKNYVFHTATPEDSTNWVQSISVSMQTAQEIAKEKNSS